LITQQHSVVVLFTHAQRSSKKTGGRAGKKKLLKKEKSDPLGRRNIIFPISIAVATAAPLLFVCVSNKVSNDG